MSNSATQTRADELFDALGHRQRRELLVALLDHNPQDMTPTVAEEVPDEAAPVEEVVEMTHIHLPKLAEYGYITYDRETEEVSKGPAFDEIRPMLELLIAHADELPDDWL